MAFKYKSDFPPIVGLSVEDFGQIKDDHNKIKEIKCFTWSNTLGTRVKVINYGGYITSIYFPDSKGEVSDIVVGFKDLEGYLRPDNSYFGCTVGRVGNRIAYGKMKINDKEYTLATNDGLHHLHGGIKGFDKVVWDYSVIENQVTLTYLSPDMEEGYPGNLLVSVTFELTKQNTFKINYKAMTTKPTIVNLTNHSYFNLAGDDTGAKELYKHVVTINADSITDVDSSLIPTGKINKVAGTVFDFQKPVRLGDVINKVPGSPGFDHNFCINKQNAKDQQENFVARVLHEESGRVLEIYSDQPGVQFYTGNFLPQDKSIVGKSGGYVQKHGAFCLETQNFPDAINHNNFPNSILNPGEVYQTVTTLKFLTRD